VLLIPFSNSGLVSVDAGDKPSTEFGCRILENPQSYFSIIESQEMNILIDFYWFPIDPRTRN
jgi:hypothetical protein